MSEKYRVIDGFDFANNPCKLIEDTKTTEQYNTENELEANSLCKLLNEQEELIKRLKTIREEQTETILKQKRKMQELEERNQRQYERLKQLTDLMQKRDWKTLENIADEWEKQEELLQAEWGTYCENG